MKIGITGSRGIPNNYGGFEQMAQFLSEGLACLGHEVFVYSPHHHPFQLSKWGRVNLIHCHDPGDRLGTAGQFIYDLNCIRDARRRDFDVLMHLGYTSDSIWHRLWPKPAINMVNMDGLEWKRAKYGRFTRRFLKWAESLAAQNADLLVADSTGIQEHLLKSHGMQSQFIPYGANLFTEPDPEHIKPYNLIPFSYSLLVARMEPENNIEMIIRGYLRSNRESPLVIVGNASNKFGRKVQTMYSDPRLLFISAIYEPTAINNLRWFSDTYFHGHSVGGTNPSLLEAMACNCNIVAHDNIFNRGVLENNADYFTNDQDVAAILAGNGNKEILSRRKKANLEKIASTYNWQKIIAAYEQLMKHALELRKDR